MLVQHKIDNLAFGAPWLLERKNQYFAFCSIEADFEFWVDAEQVFQELGWNIGELAMQLAQWLKSGLQGDFHYTCIDAEEKDLFTFRHWRTDFYFISEWATYSTPKFVTREALTTFIRDYRDDVRNRIANDLKCDTSSFLS